MKRIDLTEILSKSLIIKEGEVKESITSKLKSIQKLESLKGYKIHHNSLT